MNRSFFGAPLRTVRLALFLGLLVSHAMASAQPVPSPGSKLQLGPADLAKCAAAAGRRVSLLKDTKTLFPEQKIDTSSTLAQMADFIKTSCAFSTANFAFDTLAAEQDKYQIREKQLVERCKVTNNCISEYMEELDSTLRRCEIYKAENAEMVRKLVSAAPIQCSPIIND
jgi:hypothetical protein